MNVLDFIIVALFLAVFAVTFFAGVWRGLVGLLSLAVGLVVASYGFRALSSIIGASAPSVDPSVRDVVAFIALLVVVAVLVGYVVQRSFHVRTLRTRRVMEARGGALGLVLLLALSTLMAITVVSVAAQASHWSVEHLPEERVAVTVREQFSGSVLLDAATAPAGYVYEAVAWVSPGSDPLILRPEG